VVVDFDVDFDDEDFCLFELLFVLERLAGGWLEEEEEDDDDDDDDDDCEAAEASSS
jgi:hypothetical protein